MRDLESRERKALEEMLGRAELSSAAAWCYPGCRIPVLASADVQITGVVAAETQRITKDLKRGTARRGCLDMYGSGGEFKALFSTWLCSESKQEGGRRGTPKATGSSVCVLPMPGCRAGRGGNLEW